MKIRRIKITTLILAGCFFVSAAAGTAQTAWAEADTAEVTAEDADEADDGGSAKDGGSSGIVDWPVGPSESSMTDYGLCLMDAETGQVLYEKNYEVGLYPASTTKILTTLLALENCEMDDIVTFSHDAVYNSYGSGIARDEGEQLTVEQTLYAVMLESANECAYAIAEHTTGGDYDAFIQMMNDRAEELGCKDTHFNNPNGLPDPDHWTTAGDLALIARACYQNDEFMKICGTVTYEIPPTNKHDEALTMFNHHRMLSNHYSYDHYYEYCIGGKTGYTDDAKNTLVTYARKDGVTLICVALKCPASYQYKDSRTLLDWGFENFATYDLSKTEDRLDLNTYVQRVTGVLGGSNVTASVADPVGMITIPAEADFADTEYTIELDKESETPAFVISYTYDGREVGSGRAAITVTEKAVTEQTDETETTDKKTTSGNNMRGRRGKALKAFFAKKPVKIIGVIILVLVILYVILFIRASVIRSRRRKRRARGRQNYERNYTSRPRSMTKTKGKTKSRGRGPRW